MIQLLREPWERIKHVPGHSLQIQDKSEAAALDSAQKQMGGGGYSDGSVS